MQNQSHNQQQLQGSNPSLTTEENQVQYVRCMENTSDCSMFNAKAYCNYDHFRISNELSSHGNPVTNEVRNGYDQNCPSPRQIPIEEQLYMNHQMMNQMMNHQIQTSLPAQEPPPPDTIWFYNRNELYYEFTNFKEGFPIKAAIQKPHPGSLPDVKSWPTSEHLFQAAKFKDTHPEIADKIRMCRTARDALNMARKYHQFVDPNWQSINVQVMEWVVKNKFEQHPVLAKRLLETGDKKLVEHTEVDKFWGDGGDGSGRNMLGEVLMRVRQQLRDTQSHLKNNNGENNPSTGSIEETSIYSMSGPASSSTSSLQAYHMYAGNGNIHLINRNIEQGQGHSSQLPPPISQEKPTPPPPLPPRRHRDIQRLQEVQQRDHIFHHQPQHQQQHHQQKQPIQQHIQQHPQQLQIQFQQETVLNPPYLQQMQPQRQIANVYIQAQDGDESNYYNVYPPPYSEY